MAGVDSPGALPHLSTLSEASARARFACAGMGDRSAASLRAHLAVHGWRTEPAGLDRTARRAFDGSVLDLRSVSAPGERIVRAVRGLIRLSPDGPVYLVLDPDAPEPDGLAPTGAEIVRAGDDLSPLAARIRYLHRMRSVAEEAAERIKTLAAAGSLSAFPRTRADLPPRALVAGHAGRQPLAMIAALQASGVKAFGALSAAHAISYLEDGDIDCVVLCVEGESSATSALPAALRGHPRLSDTPVIATAADAGMFPMLAAMGAIDAALFDEAHTELPRRVAVWARRRRLLASLRCFLRTPPVGDAADAAAPLYTQTLFARHLSRLALRSDQTGRPISLAVLRLSVDGAPARFPGAELFNAVARRVCDATRAEDFCARLSRDTIAVAMPGTVAADAASVCRRIAGAFPHGRLPGRAAGSRVGLVYGVAQRQQGDMVEETLAQALAALSGHAAPHTAEPAAG